MSQKKASKETLGHLAYLEKAATRAGSTLYERVKKAKAVFEDKGWVFEYHNGSDQKAVKSLAEKYLGDVCCTLPLATLFEIFSMFPQKRQWQERDFNLQTLYAEWKVERKNTGEKGKQTRRSFTLKEKEEFESQIDERDKRIAELEKELQAANQRAADAEAKCEKAERRVAFLEGKLDAA